jgi:SOS-response transcriptional repressor LexA
MTEFGNRIKQARKLAKLTQAQLARAVGISQGSLSEMENEGLSSTYTVQIAHACGVNANWLATGVGGITLDAQNVTSVNFRAKVPVISWEIAAKFQGVSDVFQPGEAERFEYVRDTDVSAAAFSLEVYGDSMLSSIPGDRSFPPGTMLIVDPGASAAAGDYVIARDAVTQKPTFKQLTYDGGRWFLRPLNPIYPTMEIDDPAIRVIGKVVEYSLRGKLP